MCRNNCCKLALLCESDRSFSPFLLGEPLIFIEVALLKDVATSIQVIKFDTLIYFIVYCYVYL